MRSSDFVVYGATHSHTSVAAYPIYVVTYWFPTLQCTLYFEHVMRTWLCILVVLYMSTQHKGMYTQDNYFRGALVVIKMAIFLYKTTALICRENNRTILPRPIRFLFVPCGGTGSHHEGRAATPASA